jgi:surface protein
VDSVTDMSSMFDGASAFDGEIGGWNVSSVTRMGRMFADATTFNAPIGGWDVDSVTDMSSMFDGADAFHQCLPWHEDFGAPLYCGFTDNAELMTAVGELK